MELPERQRLLVKNKGARSGPPCYEQNRFLEEVLGGEPDLVEIRTAL